MDPATGMVFLVGAGPGDPGLITVKGMKCLEQARVIVYDALVNPTLLRFAPPAAQLIYVGKKGSRHAMEQAAINALLIEQVRAGRQVVRLKGGDPFLFGRGGEEVEALADAGVPFEVVPGVSSATAVPAYAGIPVTHRALTSTLTIVTGHECAKAQSGVSWENLAPSGATLVILMGMKNLAKITANLLERGHKPDTPCAVIQWGTRPEQRTVVGTLRDIAAQVAASGLGPPGVIIAGDVVRLRPKLNWFERKPLFGQRIVVTRSRNQAGDLMDLLEFFGAEALPLPTIEILPVSDPSPLDAALSDLGRFDWLVFTSVNAVDAVFERLTTLGKDARALHGVRLCAIGPATARRLASCHLRADLIPEEYRAQGIIALFEKLEKPQGKRFLLPRADLAPSLLPDGLRRLGAEAIEIAAYRTVMAAHPPEYILRRLQNGEVHFVTLTSSSTAENFARMIGTEGLQKLSPSLRFASIGPSTSATARKLGLSVAVEAREHTIPGLVKAIVESSSLR